MTTNPDVLTVTGACKRFGNVAALDGATLALRAGELLALLGPNGAGKTTLIRAISGRVQLDAGEIRLFGQPIAARRTPPELGIVPQELAVYPLLTPRENLEAFGRMQGLRGRDLADRVGWALELSALGDRAGEMVKGFSGGMKRRLNIACGVLHRPRVVLLDEPTVGVDPQSRERIYDMLTALTREGVSLILTTHHLEEAEARCTRTVIIDHGRVIAAGTLAELVEQTVGRHRVVVLRTDAPALPPEDVEADADDPRLLRARVTDVARELPRLLAAVSAQGRAVEDVEVKAPSLQSVFIHLTGKDLRE
jgi:ABC-2 type transport system ATP-binding protein